jgi:hypothetical protein
VMRCGAMDLRSHLRVEYNYEDMEEETLWNRATVRTFSTTTQLRKVCLAFSKRESFAPAVSST